MRIILSLLMTLFILACSTKTTLVNAPVSALFIEAERNYAAGHYKQAEKRYLKVLEYRKNHLESSFKLANIAMRRSDYKRAHYYYAKVIHISPGHVKSHHNITLAHLMAASKHITDYIKYSRNTKPDVLQLRDAINNYINPAANFRIKASNTNR